MGNMTDFLKDVGTTEVERILLYRVFSWQINVEGAFLKNSYGIPSSPGAFQFFAFKRTVSISNVVISQSNVLLKINGSA